MKVFTVQMSEQQLEVIKKALVNSDVIPIVDEFGDNIQMTLIGMIQATLETDGSGGIHSFIM